MTQGLKLPLQNVDLPDWDEPVSPTLAGADSLAPSLQRSPKSNIPKEMSEQHKWTRATFNPMCKGGPRGLPISNTSVASSHIGHMGTDSAQVRGQQMNDREGEPAKSESRVL